jgi:hypothetical protein
LLSLQTGRGLLLGQIDPWLLASMLYWVPLLYDVLLYQVFPPEEWLA